MRDQRDQLKMPVTQMLCPLYSPRDLHYELQPYSIEAPDSHCICINHVTTSKPQISGF